MKRHSGSCSCINCAYKSHSRQSSVQKLLADGTRIDKLFYGKYLPLRERKLLEKLIRTRAVYDDVRDEILSVSESSDQTPRNQRYGSVTKSSEVLKMVDLVDRGQIRSSNTSRLSSCCNCCSCSSIKKIKRSIEKHPPYVHKHYVPYENIAKYKRQSEKRARARRNRIGSKLSTKLKGIPSKVKNARSEPCLCTLSLIKFSSKAIIKTLKSKRDTRGSHDLLRREMEQESRSKPTSVRRLKKISHSIVKSIQSEIETLKRFRIKKDSLSLFRAKLRKKRAKKHKNYEPGSSIPEARRRRRRKTKGVRYEKPSTIGKHSQIRLGKVASKSSQHQWKEPLEFSSVSTSPLMKNLKSTISHASYDRKRIHKHNRHSSSQSNITQSNKRHQVGRHRRKKHQSKKAPPDKRKTSLAKIYSNAIEKRHINEYDYPPSKIRSNKKSTNTIHTVTKSVSNFIDKGKTETHEKRRQSVKKKRTRLYAKGSNTMSQVNKKKTKLINTAPLLQRCFCTLKYLRHKSSLKNRGTMTPPKYRNVKTHRKSKNQNSETPRHYHDRIKLLPYECDPGICTPERCDPYECENLIKLRNFKHKNKYSDTDNTSQSSHSMTPNREKNSKPQQSHSFSEERKTKQVDYNPKKKETQSFTSNRPARQAVKISSSFSFNMEFYKENSEHINDQEINKKTKSQGHENKRNITLKDRASQHSKTNSNHVATEPKVKKKSVYVGSPMKTCMCTLKLHKRGRNAVMKASKHNKGLKPNVEMNDLKTTTSTTKSTKTNKGLRNSFKRYECAPGYCVPDLCYPQECYDEIKRRKKKQYRDRYIATERKITSVMSMTSSEFSISNKSKSTQSAIPKQIVQDRKIKAIKMDTNYPRSRQAVRIGSSFNFSVDFYKDQSLYYATNTRDKTLPTKYSAVSSFNQKQRKHKGTKHNRYTSKSSILQTNNVGKKNKTSHVGHMLKRCFCTLTFQKQENGINIKQHNLQRMQPVITQFTEIIHKNPYNKSFDKFRNIRNNNNSIFKANVIEDTDTLSRSDICMDENTNLRLNQYETKSIDLNLISKRQDRNLANPFKTCPQFNNEMKNAKNIKTPRNSLSKFEQYEDYQVKYIFNNNDLTQLRNNPFYRSYYALNLKVSQIRKRSKPPVLEDDECEPDFCVPYQCDKVECSQRIKSRFKSSKQTDMSLPETRTVASITQESRAKRGSTKYSQADKNTAIKTFSRPKRVTRFGSKVNVKMSVYRHADNTTAPSSPLRSDYSIYNENKLFENKPCKKVYKEKTRSYDCYPRAMQHSTHSMYNRNKSKSELLMKPKRIKTKPKILHSEKIITPRSTKILSEKIISKSKSILSANKKINPQSQIIMARNKTSIASSLLKRGPHKFPPQKSRKSVAEKEQSRSTMIKNRYTEAIYNENRGMMTNKLDTSTCSQSICVPECTAADCNTDKPRHNYSHGRSIRHKFRNIRTNRATRLARSRPSKMPEELEKFIVKPQRRHVYTIGSNLNFSMQFYREDSSGLENIAPRDGPVMKDVGSSIVEKLRCFCTRNYRETKEPSVPKLMPRKEVIEINKPTELIEHKASKITKKDNTIKKDHGDGYEDLAKVKTINNISKCTCKPPKKRKLKCLCEQMKADEVKQEKQLARDEKILASTPKSIKHETIFKKGNNCECDGDNLEGKTKNTEDGICECDSSKKRRFRSKTTKVLDNTLAVKSAVLTYDKSTVTKAQGVSKNLYECEPHVCVPGVCDPNVCFKIFKSKQKQFKHMAIATTKNVQSKSVGTCPCKQKMSIVKRCFCILTLNNKKYNQHKPSDNEITPVQSFKKPIKHRKRDNIFRKNIDRRMVIRQKSEEVIALMPKAESYKKNKRVKADRQAIKTLHNKPDHQSKKSLRLKLDNQSKQSLGIKPDTHLKNNMRTKPDALIPDEIEAPSFKLQVRKTGKRNLDPNPNNMEVILAYSKDKFKQQTKKAVSNHQKSKTSKQEEHNNLKYKEKNRKKFNTICRCSNKPHGQGNEAALDTSDAPKIQKINNKKFSAICRCGKSPDGETMEAAPGTSDDIKYQKTRNKKLITICHCGKSPVGQGNEALPGATNGLQNEKKSNKKLIAICRCGKIPVTQDNVVAPGAVVDSKHSTPDENQDSANLGNNKPPQADTQFDKKKNTEESQHVQTFNKDNLVTHLQEPETVLCSCMKPKSQAVECLQVANATCAVYIKSFLGKIQNAVLDRNACPKCKAKKNLPPGSPITDLCVCKRPTLVNPVPIPVAQVMTPPITPESENDQGRRKVKKEKKKKKKKQDKKNGPVKSPPTITEVPNMAPIAIVAAAPDSEMPLAPPLISKVESPKDATPANTKSKDKEKKKKSKKKAKNKGDVEKEEFAKTPPQPPLFNMIVDAGTMKVTNKEDIYRCLGPSCGKRNNENQVGQNVQSLPPAIDLVIGRDEANILNSDNVLRKFDPSYARTVKRRPIHLQNTGRTKIIQPKLCPYCHQMHKDQVPILGVGTQDHSEQCKCCICVDSKGQRKLGHPKNCTCCYCRYGCRYGKSMQATKQLAALQKVKKVEKKQKDGPPESGIFIVGDVDLGAVAGQVARKTVSSIAGYVKRMTEKKPCFCGLKVCEEEWKKVELQDQKRLKENIPPPCVCGSDICKKKYEKDTPYYKDQRKDIKKKVKTTKISMSGTEKRLKEYRHEDVKAQKRIKKLDKKAMKQVKKYKNADSCVLLAESAADIGRLSINTTRRMLTGLKRAILYPSDVKNRLKRVREDPQGAYRDWIKTCKDSGYSGTAARVRHRCAAMQTSQYLVSALEAHPLTNYMYHLRDKDPKKRLTKISHQKEPRDFECSPYMASLRKKPCLWLYYLCPWFYPHCLGMLSAWRQFTDIILFILAVGVWSPCILCTEFCRTVMCCLMCAGGG